MMDLPLVDQSPAVGDVVKRRDLYTMMIYPSSILIEAEPLASCFLVDSQCSSNQSLGFQDPN